MKYTLQNAEHFSSWKKDYGLKWMEPISHETYAAALGGTWDITLTPVRRVPHEWIGDVRGRRILGLAAGGGQQMPILTALGAACTVLDISPEQLESERAVAEREGYRIETGDVEAHLAALPGIRECAVVPKRKADGTVLSLVAFVVPEDGSAPAPAAIRAELSDVLPDYMIPKSVRLLDRLPVTPNGKTDRKALIQDA